MVADGVTEEETVANSIEGAGAGGEEEVRCIKKVMQVRDFLQDISPEFALCYFSIKTMCTLIK